MGRGAKDGELDFQGQNRMKKHTHQNLSNLKSKWSGLCDLDRAEAIKQALDTGMSGRELEKALDISESLIRHLKPLVEALPEEKQQARRREISTRELKRRIADRKAAKAYKQEQSAEHARLKAAHQGFKHIMHWFNEDEKIAYPQAEQIVLEARRKLREAERDGLPKEKAPAGLSVSEIIRHCDRAVPATTDDVNFIERYANWLALWAYHAMPDARVRDEALDIALDELMVRST